MRNIETLNKYLDNDHTIVIEKVKRTGVFFDFKYNNSKGNLSELEMKDFPELDVRLTMGTTYDLIDCLTNIIDASSFKKMVTVPEIFHCSIRPDDYIKVHRTASTIVIEMSTLYVETKQTLTIQEAEKIIIELEA